MGVGVGVNLTVAGQCFSHRQGMCRDVHSLPISELLTRASCRKDWKRISAESSLISP